MANTTFVDKATPIVAAWLNDVNADAYLNFVNVKNSQFGAKGDGVTDDTTAIQKAIDYVDSLGGGVVWFPQGQYATTTGITIGNGSNSQVSTKHHRITLKGAGYGSGAGILGVQLKGASTILYTGASSSTASPLNIAGPIYGIAVEDLELNCNTLAGYGLNQIHLTQGTFTRVSCRNYTVAGYNLTTRTGFPSGCAFGNGDNRYYDCYGFLDNAALATSTIKGIILTSGVNTASTLIGAPDSARNIFIGGTFVYGTTATSYGVLFQGADNNTLMETEFSPYGGSTSGKDIWFEQWPGSGAFPLENYVINPGMGVGIGGNGGVGSSWGNTVFPLPTSDSGQFPPAVTGLSGGNHKGQTFVGGVQAYRGRQISQSFSTTPQSTSSMSFSDITGYSVTLTTQTGSFLDISFAGSATKVTAQSGYYEIALNGTSYGETQAIVGATGFYQSICCRKLLAVGAGTQVVTVRFASSDANATFLNNGTLTVQELY